MQKAVSSKLTGLSLVKSSEEIPLAFARRSAAYRLLPSRFLGPGAERLGKSNSS